METHTHKANSRNPLQMQRALSIVQLGSNSNYTMPNTTIFSYVFHYIKPFLLYDAENQK